MGTAFLLLWTALRTIFRPKNAINFAYKSQNFSGGNTPGPLQKHLRCLDPDTNFRWARQRSHCSCFTKRPPIGCQYECCLSAQCLRLEVGREQAQEIINILEPRLPITRATRVEIQRSQGQRSRTQMKSFLSCTCLNLTLERQSMMF